MNNLKAFTTKWRGKRVDEDNAFLYQCNDLTRQRLKESGLPQYARLGSKGVIHIGWNPAMYLNGVLKWVNNNPKDKYQVPKVGDIVILNKPSVTGHIAIIENVYPGQNKLDIFEQNGGSGNGDGLGGNSCRTRTITYVNVMGWITR